MAAALVLVEETVVVKAALVVVEAALVLVLAALVLVEAALVVVKAALVVVESALVVVKAALVVVEAAEELEADLELTDCKRVAVVVSTTSKVAVLVVWVPVVLGIRSYCYSVPQSPSPRDK